MVSINYKMIRKIDSIIKLLEANGCTDDKASFEVKNFICFAERVKKLIADNRITIKYL